MGTEMVPIPRMEQEEHSDEATALQLDEQQQHHDEDEEEAITMEQAMDRIGHGKFQWGIMVAAGLCFAADAMEILLLSFLSVVLKEEWQLTDTQFSWIFGSIFMGAFIGTLTLGRLGDLYGRKPIFVLTASLIAFFGVGTAFVQTYPQLLLARFFVGFGVGGITVPFDTLAEITTTRTRGTRLVSTSYFWTTATLMVPILAWATLGQSSSSHNNWRLFVALCAIPCVISAIVGIYAVPESPRWLLQQGDAEGALLILRKAAIVNGKDPSILGNQLVTDEPVGMEKATIRDLLSPEWYKTTIILWCLWGSYAFLYYGTVIAVTLAFFKSDDTANKDDNNNGKTHSYEFDYFPIILSSSAEVAGVTLVLFTVDRFGRINCLSLYFLLGGLSVLGLCGLEKATVGDESKMLLAFLARFFVYSGSNIVWILTAELLTTEIRTTGHSAANAVARVGAFLAPFLVQPTENPIHIGIIMFLASLFSVTCARHLPETVGQPLGGAVPQQTHHHHRNSRQSRNNPHLMVPCEELT